MGQNSHRRKKIPSIPVCTVKWNLSTCSISFFLFCSNAFARNVFNLERQVCYCEIHVFNSTLVLNHTHSHTLPEGLRLPFVVFLQALHILLLNTVCIISVMSHLFKQIVLS